MALALAVLFTTAVFAEETSEGMVLIPESTFVMGAGLAGDEPKHTVTLSAYYIDRFEVTQAQFRKVMGKNPSDFKGENLPVEQVTWYEARDYCKKVGKRLPTEAEWERAAAPDFAIKQTMETGIDTSGFWYWENSNRTTHPVGKRKANALGIHDLLGNVWEWTADYYSEGYYQESPERDPKGPFGGKYRVMRGGSWRDLVEVVRPTRRNYDLPNGRFNHIGFRCVKGNQDD